MKNKFLAIVAASTAAVGSAILSAPAQAQVTTPIANVGVSVTVPEIIYLRTVSTISIPISPSDIFTAPTSGVTQNGTGGYLQQGGEATPTSSPLSSAGSLNLNANITKTIPQVYAVWSNSSTPVNVNVNLANPVIGTGSGAVTLSNLQTRTGSGAFANSPLVIAAASNSLTTPVVGDVQLTLAVGQSGTVTGTNNITITATNVAAP